MAVSLAANSDTFNVSTPGDRQVRFTRLFNAPRQLVFDALTKPEHIKRWWGCLGDGYSVPVCEVDLRVGGKWRFINRHPQGDVEFYGEYREITPPERLVYTEIFAPYPDTPSLVTAELIEEHGKTRMNLVAEYPSLEVRNVVMSTGMERGAAISYDRMEDLLAELQR